MNRACPDCEQGKHQNCTGYAWDTKTDQETVCPCAAKLHVTSFEKEEP